MHEAAALSTPARAGLSPTAVAWRPVSGSSTRNARANTKAGLGTVHDVRLASRQKQGGAAAPLLLEARCLIRAPQRPTVGRPCRVSFGQRDTVWVRHKDGFRLLVDVGAHGRVRAWSRHGTSLTPRLGSLLALFETVVPGTTFDGELVAIGQRDGRPTQDFGAVTRGVFTGECAASDQLRFVAFDVLRVMGEELRCRPWRERDERLRDALPMGERIRVIASQRATRAAHEAIVALGFEGTVLKRPSSTYRAGRHRTWVKHKAHLTTTGEVVRVRQDRDGQWHALCDLGDRRVRALADVRAAELIGEQVELVYSRVDADGGLREARIAFGRRADAARRNATRMVGGVMAR